jgi:hypothetical protein
MDATKPITYEKIDPTIVAPSATAVRIMNAVISVYIIAAPMKSVVVGAREANCAIPASYAINIMMSAGANHGIAIEEFVIAA